MKQTPIHDLLIVVPILLLWSYVATAAAGEAPQSEAAPYIMGEVVVTSEKIQDYIRNHPQGVKVMERQEIVERGLSSTEEILRAMPGVEVYPSTGIGARVSIRGSGKSSGVLVLLNGRPLNANQYGSLDLNTVPVDLIESVTVFKPPVPVWLGPGASEGAINIVTRSIPSAKNKKEPQSSVKASGGSYGFAEGGLTQPLPLAGGSALVLATAKHRDGKRDNSDRSDNSLAFNWSRETETGNKYQAGGRYYQADYGAPGPTDNLTPDARQQFRKGSLDTSLSGTTGDSGIYTANGYADLLNLRDKAQSGAIATLDDRKAGLKLDTTWSGENEAWELRLGGMAEVNGFDHTLAGEHQRLRNGLSTQYDRRFEALTATAGLRGDVTNDFDFNPGGSLGAGYAISEETLLKARTGYTINVPTFEQLYQSGHASIDQSRGNPDLREERIWSHDLGLEYTPTKDRTLQASLFRADTRDLISYQRGADRIYRPVNIAEAWRQGLDLTGKYGWSKGLSAEMNLILQHSDNSRTGESLAYTPAVKVKTTLKWVLPSLKTRLEGTVRHEGRRFSQVENLPSQELDRFTTVDLKATQPFTLGGAAADWQIKIDNLFDTAFESHLGYPDDGIRVTAGLQVRF